MNQQLAKLNYNTEDTNSDKYENGPKKWLIRLIPTWLIMQAFFWGPASPRLGIGLLDNHRLDRAVFVLIIVFFGFLILRGDLKPSPHKWVTFFMFVFTIYSIISLIQSGANSDPMYAKNKWVNALANITIFPFTTYYIISKLRLSSQQMVAIVVPLCFFGAYLGVVGIAEHFNISPLIWPRDIGDPSMGIHFGRSRGPFLESVAMGRVLTICFMCFALLITRTQGMWCILNWLFLMATVASIYYTETRGPWLGFGICLFAILIIKSPMKKVAKVLLTAVFIAALSGASNKFSFSEGTLFTKRQNTISDRAISNAVTLKMAMDHFFLGIGYGRFGTYWGEYFSSMSFNAEFGGFDGSHNTFLTTFAEMGILGIGLYLLIFLLLGHRYWKTLWALEPHQTTEKSFIIIAGALMVMYGLSGFVSDLRWSLMQNNLVFMFFGFAASISATDDEEDAESENSPESRATLST